MHFNLSPFASCKQVAHRASGARWCVTVAAGMTEHDGFEVLLEEAVTAVWRDLPVSAITVGELTLTR